MKDGKDFNMQSTRVEKKTDRLEALTRSSRQKEFQGTTGRLPWLEGKVNGNGRGWNC